MKPTQGMPTSSFFANQKSTNEWNTLKDYQDRYSEPSYYTDTNSNTFRIPDNRITLAVRNPQADRGGSTSVITPCSKPRVNYPTIKLHEIQFFIKTHSGRISYVDGQHDFTNSVLLGQIDAGFQHSLTKTHPSEPGCNPEVNDFPDSFGGM